MTVFHSLEDITIENVQKALDEIREEVPTTTSRAPFNPRSFKDINEAVDYLKAQGDIILEEYMNWARETCGL